ncbi:hypothetical protein SAMN05216302_10469 [Nitrosomonas aestuarii]|uniref:Phage protein D n=1 Tax=Nitrosomonas aestuarii TaxID=52441 RepID=A0A1I4G2Z0_9PROT|nr:hypothetical protein [Nitrosomonas aestuarii]SFL23870.1 hypothetical protein SAMN05216302_10469 [Nitrosomonas aestuarii]
MILYLSSGEQIRGDLIKSAVIRSDMSPVPVTLEAEIRIDEDMESRLIEGETITLGGQGDEMRIIKSVKAANRIAQGSREMDAVRITALLSACHAVSFVRERAIVKENVSLSAIYRAAGAQIRAVQSDFPVPRFYCMAGDTPSFHINRALQEEGGIVRWKDGRLAFFRLADLFKQDSVMNLPNNASDDVDSGFVERHEIPWFISIDDNGGFVMGDRRSARSVRFSPFKNAQRLRNMSACLVQRKVSKINLATGVVAGDLINVVGGDPLCVITAAHVFESGTDGSGSNQYTKLWLGDLREI